LLRFGGAAQGDVCLLLIYHRLLSAEQLAIHRHSLVVQESAQPQGQGRSPMNWQILEGVSRIPITLSKATADLDAGPSFLQQELALQCHQLVDEWRALQPRPHWTCAWPGSTGTARWWPQQPSPSTVKRDTTSAAGRPIPSWIPSAPWQSSSTCCGLWTTSAIRSLSTGAAGALCCRCIPSPYDPLITPSSPPAVSACTDERDRDQPVSADVEQTIRSVLEEHLSSQGLEGVLLNPGLDHDGDPVLFMHLKFRLVEPGINPRLLSDCAITLRRALWEMMERRFPHLRYDFHDDQRILGTESW